jgi:hypothetical protein
MNIKNINHRNSSIIKIKQRTTKIESILLLQASLLFKYNFLYCNL